MSSFSVLAGPHGPGPALVVAGREVSWAELAETVEQVVSDLESAHVDPATPIALVGHSDLDTLVRLYALFHRRTPVVLLHPRSPEAEHRGFLEDCGNPSHWRAEEPLPDGGAEVTGWSRAQMEQPIEDDEAPMVVVRTSGSSGGPKGVVLSRRAMWAAAQASAENLGWQSDDRWLLSLPVAHVGGLSIVTRCLLARRTVVLEPDTRFDARQVAKVLEHRRVTLASLVPTTLRRLLNLEGWDLPSHVRALLVGGAPADPELLRRAAERSWPVLTTYGCTEAASQIATQRPGTLPNPEEGCGPPLPGTEVRIEDGAIEVRGPTLFSGYLPPRDSTFGPDGYFRTGDLGHLDDAGRLHVLGRRDAVILSGGENVHPLEVEAVLAGLKGVSEAVVWGVDDSEWGQVVAAVLKVEEWRPGPEGVLEPIDGEHLRTAIRDRLAPHQRPRHLVLVSDLPRTPVGKVDRRVLVEWASPRLERGT